MNKTWWKAAGVRAVKTVAQTAIAMMGTAVVISAVDWKMVVSAAVLAGIISILTSIKGLPEVDGADYVESEDTAGDEYVTEDDEVVENKDTEDK